ncbi:hypothetical protein TWF281_011010 [Arthrobotrys megalospora]
MKVNLVIVLGIFSSASAELSSPACPNDLEDPSPTSDSSTIQKTLFASKFDSFVASVAGISWVKTLSKAFHPAVLNAHKILKDLEGDEEHGSSSVIPLPDESLHTLYEFIVKHKIHCYAAKSSKQFVHALVKIDSATGTGGMSDFVESDPDSPSNDANELQTQANSNSPGSPGSPGDQSLDPRTYFQYTNVDTLKIIGAMVESYSFQLKQLEFSANTVYSTDEKDLLKIQTEFWRQKAATSFLRLWHLFEAGDPYLRDSGPWDYNDFQFWLNIIQKQTGVKYQDDDGEEEEEEGYF